jgi:hypothetical protein
MSDLPEYVLSVGAVRRKGSGAFRVPTLARRSGTPPRSPEPADHPGRPLQCCLAPAVLPQADMLGGIELKQHAVHQRCQCAVELLEGEVLSRIGEQHVIPLRAGSLKPIQ